MCGWYLSYLIKLLSVACITLPRDTWDSSLNEDLYLAFTYKSTSVDILRIVVFKKEPTVYCLRLEDRVSSTTGSKMTVARTILSRNDYGHRSCCRIDSFKPSALHSATRKMLKRNFISFVLRHSSSYWWLLGKRCMLNVSHMSPKHWENKKKKAKNAVKTTRMQF